MHGRVAAGGLDDPEPAVPVAFECGEDRFLGGRQVDARLGRFLLARPVIDGLADPALDVDVGAAGYREGDQVHVVRDVDEFPVVVEPCPPRLSPDESGGEPEHQLRPLDVGVLGDGFAEPLLECGDVGERSRRHGQDSVPLSFTARMNCASEPLSAGFSTGVQAPLPSNAPWSVTMFDPTHESAMRRSSTASGSNTRTVRIANPANDCDAPHGAPAGTTGARELSTYAVLWNAYASPGSISFDTTTLNPYTRPMLASRSVSVVFDWS